MGSVEARVLLQHLDRQVAGGAGAVVAGVELALLFASATSSFTDFTGTLGCTTSTSGTEEIQLTGARSLNGSNFTSVRRA